MSAQQRRVRMARLHHLAPDHRAESPLEVARSLVALHSTDPASVYLSCLARTARPAVASVERALYEERSLLRMLGMRRTVFVVPSELAPVIDAACTRAIAVRERQKLIQLLEQGGIAGPSEGERWLARVEEETLEALVRRGQALGQELSAVVPDLREQLRFGDETKKWAGVVAMTTRVLFLLAAEGHIVRGRPRGSWTSSQYRWVPRSAWSDIERPQPSPEVARVELARLWLAAFGPATVADLRWWTGWTAGETKRALSELALVEIDLDGQPGLLLAGLPGSVGRAEDVASDFDRESDFDRDSDFDRESDPAGTAPWAALLPALDPTVMGWAERGWFLGAEQRTLLFDRSGNAGATAWWDGHVVGAWAQRRTGEIVVRRLQDVGAEGAAALDAEAERLQQAIGEVRVTPRFRTPLERELSL